MSEPRRREQGVALIAVILVLLALVAIATPFSLSMRNQHRSATHQTYRAKADHTARAAILLAEEALAATDPTRDPTPWWDGPAELDVHIDDAAARFGVEANDPTGSIWSARAQDEQGKVDLNQCSPFLLHNLFGGTALARNLPADERTELRVRDGDVLPDQGILWIEGELILYTGREGNVLTGLQRAQPTPTLASLPARDHLAGAAAVDYRLILATVYPYKAVPGEYVRYPTVRAVKDVGRFGEVVLFADELDRVEADLTVHAALPASGPFIGATRVVMAASGADDPPGLFVPAGRNFGPGTVVRIRDGDLVEHNLVVGVLDVGGADEDLHHLLLQEPLEHDHAAGEAVVEALARAPVNVNSCSRRLLVALFEGLRGRVSEVPVDRTKAERLADRILAERPIEGEAELAGLVIALTDAGELTPDDRHAILTNALWAQDATLAFGTAPLVYRSYGTFTIEAAASENLPAGREEARAFAREVAQVAASGDQLTLFATQADFEEAMRLSRAGRFWTTGPVNLQDDDGFNVPPLRVGAAASGRFPALLDERGAFASLAPVRAEGRRDKTAWMPQGVTDRLLHFDGSGDLASDDERGWNVERQGVLQLEVDSRLVGLLGERGWVRPFEWSMWWQPGEGAESGETLLFDTGDLEDPRYAEITNRIFAFFDGKQLHFRVADAGVPDLAGETFVSDDRRWQNTELPTQMAEVVYGFDDGLAFDPGVAYHLRFHARGTKPSDLTLFVDNVPRGRRAFQTRLTKDLDTPGDAGPFANIPGYTAGQRQRIQVEDATLFPPFGVVRIGEELIEYTDRTDRELIVARASGDAFGGRAKRGAVGQKHILSESVELYGYAGILLSEYIPNGNVGLQNAMTSFGVAMVDPESEAVKKPISLAPPAQAGGGATAQQFGNGMDSTVTSIPLQPVGAATGGGGSTGTADLDEMFDPGGGYALVVSCPRPPPSNGGNLTVQFGQVQVVLSWLRAPRTTKNEILGLGELIYYGAYSNKTLLNVSRAPQSGQGSKWHPTSNLVAAGSGAGGDPDQSATQLHAHMSRWTRNVGPGHAGDQPIFVVPISVRPGLAPDQVPERYAVPRLRGNGTLPEMVQIGTGFLGNQQGGGTEWVRYDTIGNGCFVRDDPARIREVVDTLSIDVTHHYTLQNAANLPDADALARALNFEDIAGTAKEKIKLAQDAKIPPNRLDGGLLAFRGVLGTGARSHPQGGLILPVFRTYRNTIQAARPGARDLVTCIDPVKNSREEHRINYAYCEADVEGWGAFACHVAFDSGVHARYESNFSEMFSAVDPNAPSGAMNALANQNIESRDLTRILKFPSGELPSRLSEQVTFGGDLHGERSPVPSVFDELEFFNPETPSEVLPRHPRFVLSRDDELQESIFLDRKRLRYNLWDRSGEVIEAIDPVANLPQDGFVVLIDDELIGITDVLLDDDNEAELRIAPIGRSMLGTPMQFHARESSVREMTFLRASRLERRVSETAHEVVVADAADFPARGYVLIGREVLGYVRKEGDVLVLPKGRDPDSLQDVGLFRGRFGTRIEEHAPGSLVLHFPVRHEDRYHPRADDPELAPLSLFVKGKEAFFRELSWKSSGTGPNADLVVLARVGGRGAWSADPAAEPDLFRFDFPGGAAAPNLLLRQGDALELRVFTRYGEGAFDVNALEPSTGGQRGGSNDWKRAPRLENVGVEWITGPARLAYEEWR